MKKLLASLLIFLLAVPAPTLAALSESDRAIYTQRNFLVNPGAESSTAGVVASTPAHFGTTSTSTNVDSGNASFFWAPTAANETITFGFYSINSGGALSGANGTVTCRFKSTGAIQSHTIQGWDGTTKYGAQSIATSSSGFQRSNAVFTFPASGNFTLQITSGSADTVYFDGCYMGLADGLDFTNAVVTIAPTVQKFVSGSGTYTTPTNPAPLYIEAKIVGGGGGGGPGPGGSSATAGGDTTFGNLTAHGGALGASGNSNPSAGGSASVGAGWTQVVAVSGGNSGSPIPAISGITGNGGAGGVSAWGGAGGFQTNSGANSPGQTNSGSGGSGGTAGSSGQGSAGGAAGAFIDAISSGTPALTYSYAVGVGGTGGLAGTGNAGGNGGSGYIEITEYYGQSSVALYQAANGGLATGDVTASAASSCPIGTVAADGTSYLRTTFPALFTAIGTTYGAVDGTHFNVPDYRGLFQRGAGTNGTALQSNGGAVSGAALGTLQNDMLQSHYHQLRVFDGSSFFFLYGTGSGSGAGYFGRPATEFPNTSNTGNIPNQARDFVSDGTNGTPRVGAETRPANLSVTYCIRTVPATAAPVLVGSVTSNTSGQERVERAYVSGASTIVSQSGSWLSSVTNNSTGLRTLNIVTGEFSAAPVCTVSILESGTVTPNAWYSAKVVATTSTTMQWLTWFGSASSGTANNYDTQIICMGPR